jgi:hypothetical protein
MNSKALLTKMNGITNVNEVMYPILIIAGLGIGGILVPASIISTIVCPGPFCFLKSLSLVLIQLLDDLIATVSALTLSIRVIGGGMRDKC